jgi:hypothetical protein
MPNTLGVHTTYELVRSISGSRCTYISARGASVTRRLLSLYMIRSSAAGHGSEIDIHNKI